MGTLKVDNLQKRDGTALITDGAASTTLLSQAALFDEPLESAPV